MESEGSLAHSQGPPPAPILSQTNLVHVLPSHFLEIHFNISLPRIPASSKRSLSFIFPHQHPVYTSSLLQHVLHAPYLFLLGLITRIIFDEQYNHKASPYVVVSISLLPRPFTSYIFLSTLFSKTLSLNSSIDVRHQVSHPCKTTGTITFPHILVLMF
jgi:hypothetical protein